MAARAVASAFLAKLPFSTGLLTKKTCKSDWIKLRNASTQVSLKHSNGNGNGHGPPEFGLFFDIDGVIVRGRTVLPGAKKALRLLTDGEKFIVPTIFVTNAGNCLRQRKAKILSDWIGVEVDEKQVVMSHSPLKLFKNLLNKHVLVAGQGPITDIARNLGFTKVTTVDNLRHKFPMLDMVDHRRRKAAPCAFEKYFPRIEAVILFGEPVRWETQLQLIIDMLISDGKPCQAPVQIPYPHLPVLACNMDLMWMSEACMPRFAHGCFLHCLESLYKKITSYDLKYSALLGKPSELTYHHSELVLQEAARNLGWPGIKRMYCVGDNPDVDIYGANLYNQYVHKRHMKRGISQRQKRVLRGSQSSALYEPDEQVEEHDETQAEDATPQLAVESCESILVCTGVYSGKRDYHSAKKVLLDHNHRDFVIDSGLRVPAQTVSNVLEAVQMVFDKEGFVS